MSRKSQRQLTPHQTAANRRNARQSTGPKSQAGKRRARLNALRHGLFAQTFREVMVDLEEDPQEFDRLHEGLIDALQPANTVETKLVEDLARLWWKKDRAERAQAGVQIREVERKEAERLRELQQVNREALEESQEEVLEVGLLRAQNCAGKFEKALDFLQLLLAHVEGRETCPQPQTILQALFGKKPSWRGAFLMNLFKDFQADRQAAGEESERDELLPEDDAQPPAAASLDNGAATPPEDIKQTGLRLLLLEEIRDLYAEHDLFPREHVELSRAARHAYLAPTDARWTWMLRLDNYLDRQIERKLKLLMQLKRFDMRTALPAPARRNSRGGQSSPRPAGSRRAQSHLAPHRALRPSGHRWPSPRPAEQPAVARASPQPLASQATAVTPGSPAPLLGAQVAPRLQLPPATASGQPGSVCLKSEFQLPPASASGQSGSVCLESEFQLPPARASGQSLGTHPSPPPEQCSETLKLQERSRELVENKQPLSKTPPPPRPVMPQFAKALTPSDMDQRSELRAVARLRGT